MKGYSFNFLRVFYYAMMKEGVNHNIFRADIDDQFVEALNSNKKTMHGSRVA
jgi:hypothetical protein